MQMVVAWDTDIWRISLYKDSNTSATVSSRVTLVRLERRVIFHHLKHGCIKIALINFDYIYICAGDLLYKTCQFRFGKALTNSKSEIYPIDIVSSFDQMDWKALPLFSYRHVMLFPQTFSRYWLIQRWEHHIAAYLGKVFSDNSAPFPIICCIGYTLVL